VTEFFALLVRKLRSSLCTFVLIPFVFKLIDGLKSWGALIEAGLVPPEWAGDRSRGFVTSVGLWAGRVVGPSAGRVVGPSAAAFVVELGELWRDIPASLIDPAVSSGDMVNESSGRFSPSILDAPDDVHLAVALAADAGNLALAEERFDALVDSHFYGIESLTG
jgi:hypothetical protein